MEYLDNLAIARITSSIKAGRRISANIPSTPKAGLTIRLKHDSDDIIRSVSQAKFASIHRHIEFAQYLARLCSVSAVIRAIIEVLDVNSRPWTEFGSVEGSEASWRAGITSGEVRKEVILKTIVDAGRRLSDLKEIWLALPEEARSLDESLSRNPVRSTKSRKSRRILGEKTNLPGTSVTHSASISALKVKRKAPTESTLEGSASLVLKRQKLREPTVVDPSSTSSSTGSISSRRTRQSYSARARPVTRNVLYRLEEQTSYLFDETSRQVKTVQRFSVVAEATTQYTEEGILFLDENEALPVSKKVVRTRRAAMKAMEAAMSEFEAQTDAVEQFF
ncbi:hypothetical protein GYMLUDRAFT_50700 [Collybiopsis luxurians FD-317 M1]|uniref:Uncharacterized protein n=1 Tax=Collybiopsis luxurians FD-317 M1 TaxID=944289 RepID=A0A0D0BA79_9AGAR|nr:hypothetical protein GYMLUDRAFT_50700 [Collybiopsis luxurians FD-317 M1]